jgi:hypothetical protein
VTRRTFYAMSSSRSSIINNYLGMRCGKLVIKYLLPFVARIETNKETINGCIRQSQPHWSSHMRPFSLDASVGKHTDKGEVN